MSMSDPIADLLTRIRNAQMVNKATVVVPSSKVKVAIVQVLKDEGYIDGFEVKTEAGKSVLDIALKYYAGRPVIAREPAWSARLQRQQDTASSHEWLGCGNCYYATWRDD